MSPRTLITIAVVATAGVGSIAYVYNTINVRIEQTARPEATPDHAKRDFRDRIPHYDSLTNAEKRREIVKIQDILQGYEKEMAGKELVRLSRALIGENSGRHKGYVPSGWED